MGCAGITGGTVDVQETHLADALDWHTLGEQASLSPVRKQMQASRILVPLWDQRRLD